MIEIPEHPQPKRTTIPTLIKTLKMKKPAYFFWGKYLQNNQQVSQIKERLLKKYPEIKNNLRQLTRFPDKKAIKQVTLKFAFAKTLKD